MCWSISDPSYGILHQVRAAGQEEEALRCVGARIPASFEIYWSFELEANNDKVTASPSLRPHGFLGTIPLSDV